MKIILSIFIIIILIGVTFQPTIYTAQQSQKYTENFSIDVEIFGLEINEERKITLSKENMEKLCVLVKNIEEKITHSQSLEEIQIIFNTYLHQLSNILNLDSRIEKQIQKSFQMIYYLNNILKKVSIHFKGNQQNTTNYFLCFVTGDTTNTAVFRIYNIMPKPFFDWLNQKLDYWVRLLWVLFLVMITIYPLYILSNFVIPYSLSLLPVNFMTVLTLGATWAPSLGWVYIRGENVVKKWDSPLYGKIGIDQRLYLNLPAAFYPAILGFRGVKINLGKFNGPWFLLSRQFYFGAALLVSIDNEN